MRLFDSVAETYDEDFTHTPIGKIQRSQVHSQFAVVCPSPRRVLEINCGTGHDARLLAAKGYDVIATDSSPEMIRISRKNNSAEQLPNLRFEVVQFADIDQFIGHPPFDVIYSNFAGLNCISPQESVTLYNLFHKILNPGGIVFAVYFGTRCLWEILYYGIKKGRQKNRRQHGSGPRCVRLNNTSLPIWYYRPGEVRNIARLSGFRFVRARPVGLFVPPSDFNRILIRYPWLGALTQWMDQRLQFGTLADYADHYSITFQKGHS
jgi:SAM-dependent methyltransferase